MKPSEALKAANIKAEAIKLGFMACGIARAEHVDEEEERSFRRWLALGHHADMGYMANYIDKRLDPTRLLPDAKSIVCVALNYTPQRSIAADRPQIAAYALGRDYHDVVKAKLHALAKAIGCEGSDYKACVDTAPILERYWAQKAGLGFRGKNQQLIIRHAGSMCFLGELLLVREVDEYDRPLANGCGKCTRCIDVCPTKALSPTGKADGFDARRCLSYQTIENRGELSAEMAQAMGNTIYGCDRCQKACPYNSHSTPNTTPELQPTEGLLAMDADAWRHLTEEKYRQLFKGSAVKRAKYAGLMRNIHAALDRDDNTGLQSRLPEDADRPTAQN
jgi:epoxyqueuosine reductase